MKEPFSSALHLDPHIEGGWCRRTWESPVLLEGTDPQAEDQPCASVIYYAIDPGKPVIWHRIRSAEIWFYQGGSPVEVILGGTGPDPVHEATIVLGPDPGKGHRLQVVIQPDTWQREVLLGDEQGLCSCVVVPGFTFGEWEAITEDGTRLGPEDARSFGEGLP